MRIRLDKTSKKIIELRMMVTSISLRPEFKISRGHNGVGPSLISLMISVDVKHHVYLLNGVEKIQLEAVFT